MGLGYTLAILLVSFFRQLLGTGVISLLNPFDSTQIIFEIKLFADYAVSILTEPAGAFLTLGTIIGVINSISLAKAKKAKKAEVK